MAALKHITRYPVKGLSAENLSDVRVAWQAWLRQHRPPTLVAWGKNDPSFIAPGGEAFKRDLPEAELHMLDAGHFVFDEKNDEIAGLILNFLARQPLR